MPDVTVSAMRRPRPRGCANFATAMLDRPRGIADIDRPLSNREAPPHLHLNLLTRGTDGAETY